MCWLGVSPIQTEYYFMLRPNIQECAWPVVESLYRLLHLLLNYVNA